MLRESSNCKGFKLLWNINLWDVLSAQRNWQGNLSGTRIRRSSDIKWKILQGALGYWTLLKQMERAIKHHFFGFMQFGLSVRGQDFQSFATRYEL